MTTSRILSELRKHERIAPFQTIRAGTIEVYRGMETIDVECQVVEPRQLKP